jgi:peptide/nickel transport system substrate-binding protein
MSRICIAAVAGAFTLAACSGTASDRTPADSSDRAAGGRGDVLTISSPADADALLPPLVQTTQGNQASELIFDYLVQPNGKLETLGDKGFKPQLATAWTWSRDSLSIAFNIDPRARWHDDQPVRARDVAFSYALYVDPAVASPHADAFIGIDSVTVRDSLTAVVWWKQRRPEQFYQITSLAILPEHLLAKEPRATLARSSFALHPVGSGRYRFEQWTRQRQLLLVADTTNYRGRPNFNRLVWVVAADPTAASLSVLSGQADVLETLRGDAFDQARQSATVRTVEYGSLDYAFMQFNVERTVGGMHHFFGDRALRVALSEGLDRKAMVQNALDSLGAVALGPFTRSSATADTTLHQIAFNTTLAGHALDSLGWKLDANDKLRKKNGKPLQFELLVPSSSATRQKYAVLIQAQLALLGIKVDVTPLEMGLFAARLNKGDFDAALNMWRTTASPGEMREVWGSPRGKDIGANYGRYANAHLDALVDSASATFNVDERRAWFNRAYQMIIDDAPAVWLYEPRNFAAINKRVEPVGMRADAWWASLPDWRVSNARVVAKR